MNIAILIPAYKPCEELFIPFLRELSEIFPHIVIVNDGSGIEYDPVFEKCKEFTLDVIHHYINKGKGSALKSGIGYIKDRMTYIDGIITADCDGQHAVQDIIRVGKELEDHPDMLIIGGRGFDENVPFRSQLGNTVTRGLFRLSSGMKIYDTQTGLRAFSREHFDSFARLNGDRYEYEMNMLLKLRELGIKPREIKIKTIYINDNATSHYNALKDSMRIASRLLLFASGSLVSFLLDYGLFCLFSYVFSIQYWLAFIIARMISASFNYIINRKIVFGGECPASAVVKYTALALIVMALGSGIMFVTGNFFAEASVIPVIIKAVYDTIMYFINYIIQRDFVFKVKKKSN